MNRELKKVREITREYGRKYGVEYNEAEVDYRLISDKIFSLKIQKQRSKNQIVEDKIRLAKELAKQIGSSFGDVLFIGVTGSVAAGYPEPNSDIDLMLVTQRNCMWWNRLWLRLWVWHRGIPHRRYGEKEKKDEFCFNLWLEEDSLQLPGDKQNLKNAMDLILMRPILNKNKTYERFILENSWARFFVANGYERIKSKIKNQKSKKEISWLKKILNWLVFWPQWWYMKQRIGGGLVDKKRAFFHPQG